MRGTTVTWTVLPRALAGAGARSWTLPWVILLLSVGVVGMHSFGASHHSAVLTNSATAEMAMQPVPSMPPMDSMDSTPLLAPRDPVAMSPNRPLGQQLALVTTRASVSPWVTSDVGGPWVQPAGPAHLIDEVHHTAVISGGTVGAAAWGAAGVRPVLAEVSTAAMGDVATAGHGLMVMCLAVLPLLGLLLRRAGSSWGSFSRHHVHLPRLSLDGPSDRAAAGAAVSLARLCVLRT